MMIFASTRYGSWQAGLNDVDMFGFVNSSGYLLVALMCLVYAMLLSETCRGGARHPHASRRAYRTLWYGLSAGLLLFCLNKQFDLQSLLIPAMRRMAMEQVWYPGFHRYRAALLGLICCAGFAFVGMMLWALRGRFREDRFCLVGVLMMLMFVAMRFATFQDLDKSLGINLKDGVLAHGVEFLALMLMGLGAAMNLGQLVHEDEGYRAAMPEGAAG